MADEVQLDEDSSFLSDDESSSNVQDGKIENLKISIENGEPDPTVTILKLEKTEEETPEELPDVEVKLRSGSLARQDRARRYENAAGEFETGMDLTTEDEKAKRVERAKRFGISDSGQPKPDLDLNKLYESLGITEEKLEDTGPAGLRFDTIMMRGVNDLSTKDIFSYFCNYPPKRLEWIDDMSCNVVFADVDTCNRAMINLSRPIKTGAITEPAKSNVENDGDDDDRIDLVENDDSKMETTEEPNKSTSQEAEEAVHMDEELLPPGKWRLAASHSKTKVALFFRLATKADVKVKGAERKSDYYRKHGNPHYGGLTGLISKSRKQKFWRERQKMLEDEAREFVSGGRSAVTYDDDLFGEAQTAEAEDADSRTERSPPEAMKSRKRLLDTAQDDDDEDEDLDRLLGRRKKPALMSRMAADEEEERLAQVRERAQTALDEMDVRGQLEQRKKERSRHYLEALASLDDDTMTEQRRPDLRSRLSRTNYN